MWRAASLQQHAFVQYIMVLCRHVPDVSWTLALESLFTTTTTTVVDMQCSLPTKKLCIRFPTVHEQQIQWLVVLHFLPYIILRLQWEKKTLKSKCIGNKNLVQLQPWTLLKTVFRKLYLIFKKKICWNDLVLNYNLIINQHIKRDLEVYSVKADESEFPFLFTSII